MALDPELIGQLRAQVKRAREGNPEAWEDSRKLVAPASVESTLERLRDAVVASSLPPPLQQALASILREAATRISQLPGEALKELTGLPATKAVRALCVLFRVAMPAIVAAPESKP